MTTSRGKRKETRFKHEHRMKNYKSAVSQVMAIRQTLMPESQHVRASLHVVLASGSERPCTQREHHYPEHTNDPDSMFFFLWSSSRRQVQCCLSNWGERIIYRVTYTHVKLSILLHSISEWTAIFPTPSTRLQVWLFLNELRLENVPQQVRLNRLLLYSS